MPRLLPSPHFAKVVLGFSKKDSRRAERIRAAIKRFEADMRHPGLNFEKLAGTDFYSIRASRGDRIILRAAGEDRFVLVDAGEHDAIYRRYG